MKPPVLTVGYFLYSANAESNVIVEDRFLASETSSIIKPSGFVHTARLSCDLWVVSGMMLDLVSGCILSPC